MMYDKTKPTGAQIACAVELLRDLGYDLDDYDFETMTRSEVSDLIAELRDERDG